MADTVSFAALSDGLADLARSVRESVVQVHAGRRGMGSGVIWSVDEPSVDGAADATVVTNAHVVYAGRGQGLSVRLADGRILDATLIGDDPDNDLAALRVHNSGLRAAATGDSSALRIGELVIAVGNPWGHEGAVTAGVVSAPVQTAGTEAGPPAANIPDFGWMPHGGPQFRARDLIIADIRLYPGNSGGPLADARGRVVGINAMVGGGLAFSIPSKTVEEFLSGLGRERLYLGVQVATVPLPGLIRARLGIAQQSAVLILGVEEGAPADTAGVQLGDVLLAVDSAPVLSAERLPRLLNGPAESGQRTLTLLRGGQRITLTLTPARRAAA